MFLKKFIPLFLLPLLLSACKKERELTTLRLGYFPNVTHAQAILGVKWGKFQQALGNIKLEPKVFTAGPLAVEALFAGALDIAYVGPNPAINAHIKSGGLYKVIAGSSSGGAACVVQADSGIRSVADLNGKKIATPQIGNSQDVACRHYLRSKGLETKDRGGNVQVLPIANPDQLTLFLKRDIDAAWTVEPWVTRLVEEGKGRILFEESEVWKEITDGEYTTTVLLVADSFLRKYPEVVKKILRVHMEMTRTLQTHLEECKNDLNVEIARLTSKSLPPAVLDGALKRLKFSIDPISKSLVECANWAYEEGFLGKNPPDLARLIDLDLLISVSKDDQR